MFYLEGGGGWNDTTIEPSYHIISSNNWFIMWFFGSDKQIYFDLRICRVSFWLLPLLIASEAYTEFQWIPMLSFPCFQRLPSLAVRIAVQKTNMSATNLVYKWYFVQCTRFQLALVLAVGFLLTVGKKESSPRSNTSCQGPNLFNLIDGQYLCGKCLKTIFASVWDLYDTHPLLPSTLCLWKWTLELAAHSLYSSSNISTRHWHTHIWSTKIKFCLFNSERRSGCVRSFIVSPELKIADKMTASTDY